MPSSAPGPASQEAESPQHSSAFELERRVLIAMRRMIRAIDLYSRRLIAQHRITGPQLLCLNQLAETDGSTVSELAGSVQLSPSTVVRILDRLEARSLVRRERSAGDRRRVVVTATEAGRQFSLMTPYSDRHPLRQALQQIDLQDRKRLADLLDMLVAIMAAPPLPATPLPHLEALLNAELQLTAPDDTGAGATVAPLADPADGHPLEP